MLDADSFTMELELGKVSGKFKTIFNRDELVVYSVLAELSPVSDCSPLIDRRPFMYYEVTSLLSEFSELFCYKLVMFL